MVDEQATPPTEATSAADAEPEDVQTSSPPTPPDSAPAPAPFVPAGSVIPLLPPFADIWQQLEAAEAGLALRIMGLPEAAEIAGTLRRYQRFANGWWGTTADEQDAVPLGFGEVPV